ncbi:MAG: OsmC family protein [Gemmatimonadales bacterium]
MKHDQPGSSDTVRADLKVGVRWTGGAGFDTGPQGRATLHIDGDSKGAPSPPETLLCALATCTAVDVVLILEKRRTPVASLEMDVVAERDDGTPRRLTKVHLGYRISGKGIDRKHALRAIELAVTKYCTVRDSLDPEMPVTWSLVLG